MTYQPAVYTATTLGVTMSGGFIGTALTLSYLTIPALLLPIQSAPDALKPQLQDNANRSWQLVYNIGSRVGPAIGAIGAAAYAYAAYALPENTWTQKQLLLAAAVANMAVGPFTIIVMSRTNSEIIRRADAATAQKHERDGRKAAEAGSIESLETPELLQRWSGLNAIRSLIPIVAVASSGLALIL